MSSEFKNGLPLKQASAKPAATVLPSKTVATKKAFTVERVAGGWALVTILYTDDDKLVSIERTESDIKPIILEKLKIAQFKNWTSIG